VRRRADLNGRSVPSLFDQHEPVLGVRLKNARERRGLSRCDLSALSCVPQTQIAKIEDGRLRRAGIYVIRMLAYALNVTMDALLSSDDDVFAAELACDRTPRALLHGRQRTMFDGAMEWLCELSSVSVAEHLREIAASRQRIVVSSALLEDACAVADHLRQLSAEVSCVQSPRVVADDGLGAGVLVQVRRRNADFYISDVFELSQRTLRQLYGRDPLTGEIMYRRSPRQKSQLNAPM
jgi:transcriptional regulator with XRE-family HTH domain